MNTDPEVWGPDSHSFSPERWLTPEGPPTGRLPHGPYTTLASFLDGPRRCLGWRLGELQVFCVVLWLMINSYSRIQGDAHNFDSGFCL